MSKQTIKRSRRQPAKYTQLQNELLQNSGLSFAALGMLTYLLSLPDDWIVDIQHLGSHGNIGRDKTYKLVNELVSAGYIKAKERKRAKGRWVYTPYTVYETPQEKEKTADDSTNESDLPLPEKPYTEKPYTENKEINTQKKDRQLKDKNIQKDLPPTTDNPEHGGKSEPEKPEPMDVVNAAFSQPDTYTQLVAKIINISTTPLIPTSLLDVVNMLQGKSRKKQYMDFNMPLPMSLDEIIHWSKNPTLPPGFELRNPAKIQEHAIKARAAYANSKPLVDIHETDLGAEYPAPLVGVVNYDVD